MSVRVTHYDSFLYKSQDSSLRVGGDKRVLGARHSCIIVLSYSNWDEGSQYWQSRSVCYLRYTWIPNYDD